MEDERMEEVWYQLHKHELEKYRNQCCYDACCPPKNIEEIMQMQQRYISSQFCANYNEELLRQMELQNAFMMGYIAGKNDKKDDEK